MPRCARAVSLTGYYHVYDRGNSKQIIFEDDSDRYRFLSDISDRFARHEVAVLAWCLMDNHFHLMVDDPFDNLSKAQMDTIFRGVTEGIAQYNPIYTTIDYAAKYIRAKSSISISGISYSANELNLLFAGTNDMPTKCYLFSDKHS